MLITAKMNRDFKACYSDDRLDELYGDGKTPEQVATLRDGAWADVSDRDRCWILWRVIATKNKAGMRECLARMVERVLPANCDPRSRAVVEAIRQDAVTDEIIAACAAWREAAAARVAYEAVREAARAARAARVAYEAVREAAIAAYAAARAAARAAYGAAYAAYAADAAAYAARAAYAAADAACAADADAGAEMKAQIADILEFLKDI